VDHPGVPDDVRSAARALLHSLHRTPDPLCAADVPWPSPAGSLHLIAIDAIPVRRATVNPGALLQAAIDPLRQQASAIGVSLTLKIDDDVPEAILIDSEKIAWVVTALVGNALRYVRHGSRILPGGIVAVHVAIDPAKSLAIAIEDDGPGIPQAVLAGLFRRVPEKPVNPGIGLMLASETVAAHGGRLNVQSRTSGERQGTTVTVVLPVL
jgi:signal transduction histidine kinase